MSEMQYVPVLRHSRVELDAAFRSGVPSIIHDALISAAYWDEDWQWAQDQCLLFADHSSDIVRTGAAYALGLIAVFHAKLDMDRVVPVLRRLSEDPVVRPHAETSLEDIEHFIVKLKGKHKAKRLPPDWRPPRQK
jgi:hypothetical protein